MTPKLQKIKLLRAAIVDGVRRPRGWTGETTQVLPEDVYTTAHSKDKPPANSSKTSDGGNKS